MEPDDDIAVTNDVRGYIFTDMSCIRCFSRISKNIRPGSAAVWAHINITHFSITGMIIMKIVIKIQLNT